MTTKNLIGVVIVCLVLVGGLLMLHHAPAVAAPMEMRDMKKPAQMWTCGMHPQVIQDHPGNCPICHMKLTPTKAGDNDGTSGVRIDPAVVQNMGVLTAPVTRGPLDRTVRAVGMLQVPEPSMHDVTVRVSGYIEKLHADTQGMAIAQGDVLFDLYSPELQVAAQELISAQHGGAGNEESQRMIESAKRKLRLWGVADQDIDAIAKADRAPATVPFRSPASGHVEDKTVVAGSAVQAGMKLLRIEDHRTLWLDAEVYADDIESVKTGHDVTASVDGVAGKTFAGKVSFIYPHVDHMTRTEIVRTTLDNPEHALRPGMFATVQIVTHPLDDAVLVPREAVIDTGVRQLAFVADATSPGHFTPRDVHVGLAGDNGVVQIVSGLAPGEMVVTSGQFLMDVESRTAEAIQKLRAASPPAK